MNEGKIKKNKIRILQIPVILLAIILIVSGIVFSEEESELISNIFSKTTVAEVKTIKQSKIEAFISEQINYLPIYLKNKNIIVSDGLVLNSKDIYESYKNDPTIIKEEEEGLLIDHEYTDYTIKLKNNNGIYIYNFEFKDNNKSKWNEKLFSMKDNNTSINQYYETTDGYILVVTKYNTINTSDEENPTIDQHDIEIHKYDSNNNLKWIYKTNYKESGNLNIEKLFEKNNKYYMVITDYENYHLLVLNNDGSVNTIKFDDSKIYNYIGLDNNKIVFVGEDDLIIFDMNKLESSTEKYYINDSVSTYLGYDNGTIYYYEEADSDDKKASDTLCMDYKGKNRTILIKSSYDKSYKSRKYNYKIKSAKYNNGYIYTPIETTDKKDEYFSDFTALLIYNKDLNLVKRIRFTKKYKSDDFEDNYFDVYKDMSFSNDEFSVYGDAASEYSIIETYNNKWKNIDTKLFIEPVISLEKYDTDNWVDADQVINYLNKKSFSKYETYTYNNTSYLKVSSIEFNKE